MYGAGVCPDYALGRVSVGRPAQTCSFSGMYVCGTQIFCPRCEDIYYPRSEYQCSIDGAYYGEPVSEHQAVQDRWQQGAAVQ
jgi:hypothetical protein